MAQQKVSGFSKKSKSEKIDWLLNTFLKEEPNAKKILEQYWNPDLKLQSLHDDFIENTITNYYLPFGVAPNFLINNQWFVLPMVTEESSVVAAASNAAKFWMDRGGFKAEVVSTVKNGQVHLSYAGRPETLFAFFEGIKTKLIASVEKIQANMVKRGGGLIDLKLESLTESLPDYYQIHASFETLDAMGANFINSCLEQFAKSFEEEATNHTAFENTSPEVIMSILSNYVPECLVRAEVSCPIAQLSNNNVDGEIFAQNFVRAVNMAHANPRRAVTHNKGIMNGVDAVVIATGNDFRAVEAGVHAYAAREGQYKSLTHASVEKGIFKFWIELPLALGTVGGLTALHPLVKVSFGLLQSPNAKNLMQIVAVAGLAQNFAAVRSLVTTGIQKGHMKMHLMNILNQLEASAAEKEQAINHFKDQVISHSSVEDFVKSIR